MQLRKYRQITWADLSEGGALSPVLGLNAAPLGVAAAWLGADTKEVQAAKQRCKSDLDGLGAFVATGKQVYGMLGMEYPRGTNERLYVRSARGDDVEIPVGKVTYLTAPAAARLRDELSCKGSVAVLAQETVGGGQRDLQIFDDKQFGRLRVTIVDNEPWLVGKDVALALGYSDHFGALKKHVDDEDKLVCQIDSAGQKRDVTVINESGLYSMVLSSKLPGAKKFRRWVTSEVLPSIRKTGGYIPSAGLSDDEIMARALMIAQNTINEKDRTIARQAAKIEEDKPKVAFADMVGDSSKTISIGDFAQML